MRLLFLASRRWIFWQQIPTASWALATPRCSRSAARTGRTLIFHDRETMPGPLQSIHGRLRQSGFVDHGANPRHTGGNRPCPQGRVKISGRRINNPPQVNNLPHKG